MGAGRLEPVRTGRRADHLLDATRKALGAAGSSAILRADVTTIDGQRGRGEGAPEVGVSGAALDAVAEASRALTEGRTLHEALAAIAAAAAAATGAEVVVARVVDAEEGQLKARAVWAVSPAVAAELEGSRFPTEELPRAEGDDVARLPQAVRRLAERTRAGAVLQVPIAVDGRPLASLELMRPRRRFSPDERVLARLLAHQVGLAVRAFGEDGGGGAQSGGDGRLELAGEVLAAGADELRTAEQVTRLAAEGMDAVAALLWRASGENEAAQLVGSFGVQDGEPALGAARAAAARALEDRRPVTVESVEGGLPAAARVSATVLLGQPPVGALQLLFEGDEAPPEEGLARLSTFGVRAAHALRAGERARTLAGELERTRALLAVVGQAIAQLSLAHTLETAVERVAELLGAERLAVYLREEGRLAAAAGRGLAGPHVRVAERLLDLAVGPFRGRGILVVEDAAGDPQLAPVGDALAEAGIEAAIALPLHVHDDVIGLLAVYPPLGRPPSAHEAAFLSALASQLAVAVQNAQLHERAKQLGAELETALASERQAARQLRALYEISRSFAQTLSLETTLEAVARTVVELLEVDAAVIRMPDERRELLVARAIHVADARLGEPIRAVLVRPQPLAKLLGRRLFRMGKPLRIDAETAARLGSSYELLVPFLERGSTAAVVPVATPAEVLATLMILSLDPARPLDDATVDAALAVAGQAALAIDNARLYQQQKDFADTMQRSLLPRVAPDLEGLELGAVYESSARVDVGGDVYDYLRLPDGRLAVVLGDVTGHGIEATADMAMAKFVFRSLAREHPEPADFLASANDVVVGEIATGKFITMTYLVVDAAAGEVACACAGHPPRRLVGGDGSVRPLEASGLALGIEAGQSYEEARAPLAAGESVVLFTDGVVEARRERELYGIERLDRVIARGTGLGAEELARAVVRDCRSFAGGELGDDCAVVVIRHVP
ncbi:MAG: GAF domain-containing protein [Actinobacteria bacterium]|nr:MAG: GAF domain-containing protein [Actinomycetota bacterium]